MESHDCLKPEETRDKKDKVLDLHANYEVSSLSVVSSRMHLLRKHYLKPCQRCYHDVCRHKLHLFLCICRGTH